MKRVSFRHLLSFAVLFTAFLYAPLQASAQSINYGSLEQLFGEPVTTSATGKPQRVSNAPVDMHIITQDDIRRSGAKNIPEILRDVPGVNVLQSGREDYDVGIRGYNQSYSPNLLVLVNGRQVYLDDYGYTNRAAIPVQLSEIRQIEVVEGPNTALFGFNAATGVINIVTMNPLYDNVSHAGVTFGTGSYREASVVKTFQVNNKFAFRVSGGASKSDEFGHNVNSNEPVGMITSPEDHALNIDGLYQLTPKSQVRIEASNSDVHRTEMTPFNFLTQAQYVTYSLKTDYEADTDYGLVKATVYRNWLDTSYAQDLYSTSAASDISNNVSVMQLADTFKAGLSNTFRLQGEYRHGAASGTLVGPTGSSIQEDVYALSGMWGWDITPDWELTNSVRLDRLHLAHSGPIDASDTILTDASFDRVITAPSYNSGLVWKATPIDSFRLNTGRGLRMASLLDFGLSLRPGAKIGGVPVLQIGNPNIDPTVVTSYELGWNHKIKAIKGGLDAGVFTERMTDAMKPGGSIVACPAGCGAKPFSNNFVIQPGNIGWSRTFGAEFNVQGEFGGHWRWGVNDTLQRIYDHYTDASANTKDGTPVNLTNLHLGWHDGPWESDAFAYFNTRFKEPAPTADVTVTPPLVTIPAHVSFSGRVAYTFGDKLTLSLSGQSLQSARTVTSTGLETERRVFVSLDRNF